MDCIFCKLANGEIPTNIVYEDDLVCVFLDANPIAYGHSLIVPKKHYININDIDSNTLRHIQETAQKLYPKYRDKLNCIGMTLTQNNDYGQEIKHYHLHLIPRYQDDNLNFHPQKEPIDLQEVLNKLK